MTGKQHDMDMAGLEPKLPGLDHQDRNLEADSVLSTNQPRPRREDARARTAFDVKEAQRQLPGWSDDDLRLIPLLPAGNPLEPGATFVDLRDPARREFKATGEMRVPDGGLYVPRSEVPDQLWNRLKGVRTPESPRV